MEIGFLVDMGLLSFIEVSLVCIILVIWLERLFILFEVFRIVIVLLFVSVIFWLLVVFEKVINWNGLMLVLVL